MVGWQSTLKRGFTVDLKQVVELMGSSKSEDEWNVNRDKVKEACGGIPAFWGEAMYQVIVLPGVAAKTAAKFGGLAE